MKNELDEMIDRYTKRLTTLKNRYEILNDHKGKDNFVLKCETYGEIRVCRKIIRDLNNLKGEQQ